MQIDFHHATTYVTARLAGFEKPEAEIIAYAAQYVDDAVKSGPVYFSNKAIFNRISSAHKLLDLANTLALENQLVWMPFHFLPGNGGLPAGEDPFGTFIDKIVCKPNSPIAQEMVRSAILEQERSYGLHRLGVTMHVYTDSWAHQGFAGVIHEVNEVEEVAEIGNTNVFGKLEEFLWDRVEDTIPPLGHGRANIFPDMPFLSWEYENGQGQVIARKNPDDFCEAADQMCIAMKRFRTKNPDAAVDGIPAQEMAKVRRLFVNLQMKEGEKRHEAWLEAIKQGEFSFGAEEISYDPIGINSWKGQALGSSFDLPVNTYKPDFLGSNWKLFHDATQAHRFHVAHDLLPKYRICAA
ncbi:MAG: DUF6765 family protein [Candidatus Manganitrophaceae bacterium]